MENCLNYPYDISLLLKKGKAIKRELLRQQGLITKNIAILGGSTTAEIKNMLELFLLKEGINPCFYESDYNKYFEDIMFENTALQEFHPDVIYFHTTSANIVNLPLPPVSEGAVQDILATEMDRFRSMWAKTAELFNCIIIQNNFEYSANRQLGNLEGSAPYGRTYYISALNMEFAQYAHQNKNFFINDINYLSALVGLEKWADKKLWYAYKYALSYDAIPVLAASVANIIKAVYGKSKKCLVLDLDNTIWGGVIGDDGVNSIQLGRDSAVGEAYLEFQRYLKQLKNRGIILAVNSKNEVSSAKEGLSHPDSLLSMDDFAACRINWEAKDANTVSICTELNIGLESTVFFDDNPAERQLVKANLPLVEVPEITADVTNYIDIIDRSGYFEAASLSGDDAERSQYYLDNSKRNSMIASYVNYGEFLQALEMKASIRQFEPMYLERITQLVNKTNQFNLTTKRYTYPEITSFATASDCVTLYGRLTDKFGDNGLVSVLIGTIEEPALNVDVWLMSCRVLKRDMEYAVLDELVAACKARNLRIIRGYYYPTPKNALVKDHYRSLGFDLISQDKAGNTVWSYVIPDSYVCRNHYIEVNGGL